MSPWMWIVDSFAVILALVGLLLISLLVRRKVLARRGGTFDMSVNPRAESDATGWMLGIAVYRDTEVHWYRVFSLSWRPRHRFTRGEVQIDGRRIPDGAEAHALHAGNVIVAAEHADGVQQMAMSSNALTGLMAWLESSPPGRRVNNVL